MLAGNVVYAAAQWAVLSLLAKLGGGEMLGQYALAMAVTAPVIMLSHLNLRAALATDIDERHPLGDYLAVRLATTAAAMCAIAVIAFLSTHSRTVAAVILLLGMSQSLETVSDIYYGALQRRDEMARIARSMIARGIASVFAAGIALWMMHDVVSAAGALVLARFAVLLAYDRPKGSAGERLFRSGRHSQLVILRTALPLGIVLMLVSLNTNIPRYAIEQHLGTRELGAFAAVASFIAVGSTAVNSFGQVTTPRLARYYSERNLARFRLLALQLSGLAFALGLAGVAVAAVFGKLVLRLMYRPEYAAYSGLLVSIMAAAIPGYVASSLGYVMTSARIFNPQAFLFSAVAITSGIASWVLVPRFGLQGAALALAVAASLQIAGEVLILARHFSAGSPQFER